MRSWPTCAPRQWRPALSRFRLRRRASLDFEAIYLSGVERFGAEQADSYAAGFWRTVEFLSQFPHAARLRYELEPPVRAYPYRAHLIVYDVRDEGIEVLRIRHAREDWQHNA
ncbi:type II toxin-antitoxin system RelE/ParE family toxin [Sphingomonas phyllosphaerae]|uniref:type II toxin-antitoxin system RelE/ParE family toxin n=1 Tax=Sphingomonas phyllosphaerae TaxID=257003 RepID=UPI001EE1EA90|nr:type II toxin-antitoxin system RelE/ParE family toxin [Sphingomonas phyllosphaerae]